MILNELIRGLPIKPVRGPLEIEIDDVVDDSRAVSPGALFVARAGSTGDGAAHLPDAQARGASAVVCDELAAAAMSAGPGPAVLAALEPPGRLLPRLAHRLWGDPSAALAVAGITGTNGKTTTAFLLQQVLARAGRRCGLLGTVTVDDGAERRPASLTTPGAAELARLLGTMVRNGCDAVAMEVSSHALDQGRVDGIRFATAIFTNLSGDHLDYHGTMDAYAAAKARLFETLAPGAVAVVNAEDPWSARMLRDCPARAIGCALDDRPAEARARVLEASVQGMRLRLDGPWGSLECAVPLVGRHNAMNALQAACAASALGVGSDDLAAGLAACTAPPGRLEPVTAAGDPFAVLVDYAHTDDALDNALGAVRPLVPPGGRLHAVFGCGGDRDRTKRPRMASAAWRWADVVTVTSDNPRTEDPHAIVAEILAGVPGPRRDATRVEVDREAAIRAAIDEARAGDVIVIAGKGHEDYQIVGRTKRPFDDRLVARAAIRERAGRVEAVR